MQGEHWRIIGNCCQMLYFAGSLGRKKQFRTIPELNTLNRTVPYLNTLSRTILYLKTLSRTLPYPNALRRTMSYPITLQSATNRIRVLHNPRALSYC